MRVIRIVGAVEWSKGEGWGVVGRAAGASAVMIGASNFLDELRG